MCWHFARVFEVIKMSWVEAVARLKERFECGADNLRHGMAWIPASGIASQYYCEQKVEMEYTVGEIETEAKVEGRVLHKMLIRMRKTELDAIVKGIQTRKVYAASFPLGAGFNGVFLVGIPDIVVFLQSRPAFVLELKTTRGDTSKLWKDQAVQAQVYGLLLDQMAFDCSRLKLVVARLKRNGSTYEGRKKELLHQIMIAILDDLPEELEKRYHGSLRVHRFDYNRQEAIGAVTWAQDYWLLRREAVPTKNPLKCKACEFRDLCPLNLWKGNKNDGNLSVESPTRSPRVCLEQFSVR